MYPEEFIYLLLYNQKEITCDLISVKQPWCINLMFANIIDEQLEIRHQSVITMSTRKIQDFEYKTLIKKIRKKWRCLNPSEVKFASLNIIFMGVYYIGLKRGVIYSTML